VARTLGRVLIQAPLVVVATGVWSSLAIPVGLLDRTGRGCRWIAGAWSRTLLRIARIGVRVEGLGNLPTGPAVYAANHTSAVDIPIVFAHLPVDFRIIHKRSLRFVPLLGQAMWAARHIAIDRSNPFHARRSLAAAADRLRHGMSLMVFPEGTRSPDGGVHRFKRGSFALALEAGVPVVPVSLVGVKAVVPHGFFSLRPGTVTVRVHPAVSVEGRPRGDAQALAEEVREVVIAGCARGEPPSC
jgi:1-acyl-sn-glycerol-3-phosphate acyltransferase